MDDIFEIWRWVKTVAGVLLLTLMGLYALRCIVAFQLVSSAQFGHFLRGLARYLFN
jgi:hypothetical protein